MSEYLQPIFLIGLISQVLFSARLLVQWIASEKAHRIKSPKIFWQLSLTASLLFCVYAWLRHDFAILLGQVISYYIYIWNLKTQGAWCTLHRIMRTVIPAIPCLAFGWFLLHLRETAAHLFEQPDIPMGLIVLGICSQIVFTLRFVYQWWYSRRAGASLLPVTFWCISLSGSLLIVLYAILRHDPVLILGQGCGLVVYLRNIIIGSRQE